jgi:hypothetical protein
VSNAQLGLDGHNLLTKATAQGGKGWTITDGGTDPCDTPFITTWQVSEGDLTISIPTLGAGYNFQIDW